MENKFTVGLHTKELCKKLGDFTQEAKKSEGVGHYYNKKNLHYVANKIIQAIFAKKSIIILGDSDSDGIFSATELGVYLRKLHKIFGSEDEVNVDIRFTDRLRDGFGISEELYQKFSKSHDLIITTDNGTSASFLKEGISNLLVIDHHPLSEGGYLSPTIPYVLNPNLNREDGEYYSTSAGMVVYDLIKGIDIHLSRNAEAFKAFLKEPQNLYDHTIMMEVLYEYAAFTISSDMALLDKRNRKHLTKAFSTIKEKTDKIPLYQNFATMKGEYAFTQKQLQFNLTPKINRLDRMGVLNTMHEGYNRTYVESYLQPHSWEEWQSASKWIEAVNTKGKEIVSKISYDLITSHESKQSKNPPIVLEKISHPEAKIGLSGLIANRLSQKFKIPAMVGVDTQRGEYSFSGRGHNAKKILKSLIGKAEGHDSACGGRLPKEKLEEVFTQYQTEIEKYQHLAGEKEKIEVVHPIDEVLNAEMLLGARDGIVEASKGVEYIKRFRAVVSTENFQLKSHIIWSKGEYGNLVFCDKENPQESIAISPWSVIEYPLKEIESASYLIIELSADGSFGLAGAYRDKHSLLEDIAQMPEAKEIAFNGMPMPKETTRGVTIKENKVTLQDLSKDELFEREGIAYLSKDIDPTIEIEDTFIVVGIDTSELSSLPSHCLGYIATDGGEALEVNAKWVQTQKIFFGRVLSAIEEGKAVVCEEGCFDKALDENIVALSKRGMLSLFNEERGTMLEHCQSVKDNKNEKRKPIEKPIQANPSPAM